MADRKRITAPELSAKKARGERIVAITAYDYPSAALADDAGVDLILVGDSLGMVVLGHPTTLPVTMEQMLSHVQAVCRARTTTLVVADMPFLSYHISPEEAMRNAGRLIQEGGAAAVKLEGGATVAPLVERLTAAGIPVMGHLGLTPQSVNETGGFKLQAKSPDEARSLLENARALEAAGAFALVLELIPAEVARVVSGELKIPTIGIGAGPGCDGEIQIFHDLLGLFDGFVPRHTRRYAEIGDAIRAALSQYAADVRAGTFPAEENTFHQPALQDASWTS